MNRILGRYVISELSVPFFLGIAIFTSILLMNKMIMLTELAVNKGVRLSEILSLVAYILPSFFVVTIPMAFLLAVLLAFGRLSTDGELTALKSSGVSLTQMMPPVLKFSAALFFVTLFLTCYALPWGNYSFKKKTYDIVKRKIDTGIVPGKIIDSFGDMVLYINEEDKNSGRFKGILLSDDSDEKSANLIVAREGEIIAVPDNLSVALRLHNGSIHRENIEKSLQYKVVSFDTYDITISMELVQEDGGKVSRDDRELGVIGLLERARELKKEGQSYNYLMVELHKKFSIPFACVVFAFIGVPLGIQGKRAGKSHGFIISLFIIILYWMFLMAGEKLGDSGSIPPYIGMWAPNIFFLMAGMHLLRKTNKDSEIKLLSSFEGIYGQIAGAIGGIFKRKRGTS